ncbi:hypothetical protein [Oceanisphaera ostreae]|uniref:RepB-like DNA primase domain-containing protein n=1 Tax=Oceanisphaera ostreae TaxID=914151 RepID=A0ABW3KLY7_9GAMM
MSAFNYEAGTTGAAVEASPFWQTSDGESLAAPIDMLSTALCSGFGKYHTNNPDAKKHTPYEAMTLAGIAEMMEAPPSAAKDSAQWVIFSNYNGEHGRNAEHQRKHGLFFALWSDIDEAEGVPTVDILSRACGGAGSVETWLYSSKSAKEANQKARLIFPLSKPVDGHTFELLQEVLNNHIEAQGIKPDRVNETCTQVCYLPNKGEFYTTEKLDELDGCEPLNPSAWAVEVDALRAKYKAEQAATKERTAASKQRMAELMALGTFQPRTAAAQAYDSRDILLNNGGKATGSRVLSPHSSSGTAGITFRDGKWFSSHSSDVDAGMGNIGKDGKAFGDSFDLICFFEYGNDEKAAAAALSNELNPNNKQQQVDYMANKASQEALELLERQAATLNTQAPSHVDITKPHGIVGDICDLMSLKARRDIPELYPAAAMQLMSLVGHKRKSVLTDRFSILSLTIAESAVGKDNPQGTLSSIAKQLGVSKHIMGGIGSFKEMITNMIDGDGVTVYSSDEVHSIFQSIASKNAASYEQKIEAEILKMSTNELYLFRGMEKRDNLARLTKKLDEDDKEVAKAVNNLEAAEATGDPAKIKAASDEKQKRINIIAKTRSHIEYITNGWPFPYFGFMGFSTPKNMEAITADPDNIASGMLGRMLITRTGNYIPKVKRELDKGAITFQEIEVIEKLAAIQNLRSEPLEITAEASELLGKYADFYEADEQRLHNTMGAVWRRAYEQTVKVATVLALGNKYISVEDVEYANAYVLNSICDLEHVIIQVAAAANGASDQTVLKAAQGTLLKDCKASKGRTKYEITKFITRNEKWTAMQEVDMSRDRVQELIDHLISAGALETVQSPRSVRYRTTNPS